MHFFLKIGGQIPGQNLSPHHTFMGLSDKTKQDHVVCLWLKHLSTATRIF